jgi:succinate dehydrogenase/fumarate reductase cytochrome b subunit
MYDLVYDFIVNSFLASEIVGNHSYYEELALLLTHTTMWLFYVVLVMLTIHIFNSFRTMTRWW